MVSQIHLDLTGIGDKIAAAVTDAHKNLSVDDTTRQTPTHLQMDEELGAAVGKHVAAAIESAVKDLKEVPVFDATAVREQILANAKLIHKLKNAGASATADLEIVITETDDSTFAEVVQIITQQDVPSSNYTGTKSDTWRKPRDTPFTIQRQAAPSRVALKPFMRGSACGCEIEALQALYSESKRSINQYRSSEALMRKEIAKDTEICRLILEKMDDVIMAVPQWRSIRMLRE